MCISSGPCAFRHPDFRDVDHVSGSQNGFSTVLCAVTVFLLVAFVFTSMTLLLFTTAGLVFPASTQVNDILSGDPSIQFMANGKGNKALDNSKAKASPPHLTAWSFGHQLVHRHALPASEHATFVVKTMLRCFCHEHDLPQQANASEQPL